ncbi:hypothetical protein Pcinc_015025 [Petrolisthes cinctipes]|uniref:Uncharacterized protein n=1 Tax=Petrolisthes cinctipes TaxID=88211 RepID=A0AAE1KQV6_PETCI|nr:hypothetical protein Pcinc_015025 [Petrolisthes cinctipes]
MRLIPTSYRQQPGVDLGLQDKDGNSALMYAAALGRTQIVLLLLAAHRRLQRLSLYGQKNALGETAKDLALRNHHTDISTLLTVDSASLPRPAGLSAFLPARPLDLDRPPTPPTVHSQNTAAGEPNDAHNHRNVEHNTTTTQDQRQEKVRGTGEEEREGRSIEGRGVGNRAEGGREEGVGRRREGGDWRTEGRVENERREEGGRRKEEGGIRKDRSSPLSIKKHLEGSNNSVFKRMVVVSTSPGSGNEADTESLMEVEREVIENKMTDELTDSKIADTRLAEGRITDSKASEGKIEDFKGSGTRVVELRRKAGMPRIEQIFQEDFEHRPAHRPPTPARPSLPTLLPQSLSSSLNASLNASECRVNPARCGQGRISQPQRRATLASLARSSSEPRSLSSSPTTLRRSYHSSYHNMEQQDDYNNYEELDVLDSSTRSEGWEQLKSRNRTTTSQHLADSHVVPLPPINCPRQLDSGVRASLRGRNSRGSQGGAGMGSDNVLSVAKKTLEQLETVLAPRSNANRPGLPSNPPRPAHQVH